MTSHILQRAFWVAYEAVVVAAVVGLLAWINHASAKRKAGARRTMDKGDKRPEAPTLIDGKK
jgi:hypothetical protein